MADSLLSADKAVQAIRAGRPVVLCDARLSGDTVDTAVSLLGSCLDMIGKKQIHEQLSFCLRELMDNALKANMKRAHFAEHNLNIFDAGDYARGMQTFQSEREQKRTQYLELVEKQNLFTQVRFHLRSPAFDIAVSNNCPMLDVEKRKVVQRQTKARVHNSLSEVMDDACDESESAGLGLIMMLLILRQIGVPEDNFRFTHDERGTHFSISIPLSLLTAEETEVISEALSREIDSMPQFPEHILTLTNLLKNTAYDFDKVASVIKRDPGLTLEVLRMVNSAAYRRRNKIEKSEMAIGILGARGLRRILQSYGAKKALERKYPASSLERLWEHSAQIAEIASFLCTKYGIPEEEAELAYVVGLLHDIGKIVLEGRHPKLFAALSRVCASINAPVGVAENIIEGVNHAVLGAKMAAKWNLPERIVNLIRFYRTPLSAPEDIRKVAKVLYLAHLVYYKINQAEKEYELAENILNEFGFNSGESLSDLAEQAKKSLA